MEWNRRLCGVKRFGTGADMVITSYCEAKCTYRVILNTKYF